MGMGLAELSPEKGTTRGQERITVLPRPDPLTGPAFGSYAAEDVQWLLTDLSGVDLERPRALREVAIQSGLMHYSETLPVEYRPDARYVALFRDLTRLWAPEVASAIGVLGDRIVRHRTDRPVLVSLARAGTPIGILLKRWLSLRHDLFVPHFTISIIRGKGLDEVALAWLRERFALQNVVFVDGWTGKGAIAHELQKAVIGAGQTTSFAGLNPQLAVVADPGGCSALHGTTEDLLIPSACLNSTVSGLVSRTVHNSDLGVGRFHGAKFYPEFAGEDQSAFFLDEISSHFPGTEPEGTERLGHPPDGRGLKVVRDLAAEYAVHDLNLIKPGVGEATRVLLRRSPGLVLLRDPDDPRVRHICALTDRLGVEVKAVGDLPYAAVSIIARQPL